MSLRTDLGLIGQCKSGGDSVKDGPAMPGSSLGLTLVSAHPGRGPGGQAWHC